MVRDSAISRAAVDNAELTNTAFVVFTNRGDVQVYRNPGKSYFTVQVKEPGSRRIGKRVRKGSVDADLLLGEMRPLFTAVAARGSSEASCA